MSLKSNWSEVQCAVLISAIRLRSVSCFLQVGVPSLPIFLLSILIWYQLSQCWVSLTHLLPLLLRERPRDVLCAHSTRVLAVFLGFNTRENPSSRIFTYIDSWRRGRCARGVRARCVVWPLPYVPPTTSSLVFDKLFPYSSVIYSLLHLTAVMLLSLASKF